ncbi:unnamed protein product [Allacma fusca]|uniref:Peptidase S1 domain-containing protein n=1 Tax=Allacma fusca TaxID=39272 RepID=A0A8J2NX00_9HEXA|nr:unnamed protein product [Allacma fusca]
MVKVTAGVLNKRSGRVINFKSFRVHGSYNSKTHLHDVALIELQEDLQFSSTISPACLPYIWAGQTDTTGQVLGSGWGVLKENGNSPDVLMKVILDVIPNNQCQQKLRSRIDSTQVCTLTPKKDTCQGDSGGSIDASYNGKFYAFGIVSWGYGCARDNSPGVYARISEYTSWIEQNTGVTSFCKS